MPSESPASDALPAAGVSIDPRLLSGEASFLDFAAAAEESRIRHKAIVALRDAAALRAFFDANPDVAAISHSEVDVGRGDYEDRYFALSSKEAAAEVRFDSSRPPGPERDRDWALCALCGGLHMTSQMAIQNRAMKRATKSSPVFRAPFFELAEFLANVPKVQAALVQAALEAACAAPVKASSPSL